MSGLLGLLDLGAGAMLAQNAGVAVAARNTANVNTAGYSRQRIDLQAELGVPLVGGVRVGGVDRLEDQLLALRERASDGNRGHFSSLSTALTELERGIAAPSGNLVQAIAQLFGGLLDLSASPLDESLRAAVIGRAGQVATTFINASQAIAQSHADVNSRMRAAAAEATRLAAEIAAANRAIAIDRDPVLADRRDQAARKLTELVGGQARIDGDGKMRFVLGGGAVLVDGDHAATLAATPDAATGDVRLHVVDGAHRRDVTRQLDGGQLGGAVAFRDTVLAQTRSQLDQLAFDTATRINEVHRAHAGLDGVTGRDLFVEPSGVTGAAAAFALDGAVAADPRLLAGATAGEPPGDNAGFRALVGLKDQPIAGGGTRTFVDESIALLGGIGAATASARGALDLEMARADILAGARDSLSGVSLSEEASRLAQFQAAADAAVRFTATVNDMLDYMLRTL